MDKDIISVNGQKYEVSKYQYNIFDTLLHTPYNIVVEACAGSGKTTTIIKMLDFIENIFHCCIVWRQTGCHVCCTLKVCVLFSIELFPNLTNVGIRICLWWIKISVKADQTLVGCVHIIISSILKNFMKLSPDLLDFISEKLPAISFKTENN